MNNSLKTQNIKAWWWVYANARHWCGTGGVEFMIFSWDSVFKSNSLTGNPLSWISQLDIDYSKSNWKFSDRNNIHIVCKRYSVKCTCKCSKLLIFVWTPGIDLFTYIIYYLSNRFLIWDIIWQQNPQSKFTKKI